MITLLIAIHMTTPYIDELGRTVAISSVKECDPTTNHVVEDLLQLFILAGIVPPQKLVSPVCI